MINLCIIVRLRYSEDYEECVNSESWSKMGKASGDGGRAAKGGEAASGKAAVNARDGSGRGPGGAKDGRGPGRGSFAGTLLTPLLLPRSCSLG